MTDKPWACFCVIQTGPWEGEGSWCYKVYCKPHGWSDLALSRDEALQAVEEHRELFDLEWEEA
jgi:hypothetical protein